HMVALAVDDRRLERSDVDVSGRTVTGVVVCGVAAGFADGDLVEFVQLIDALAFDPLDAVIWAIADAAVVIALAGRPAFRRKDAAVEPVYAVDKERTRFRRVLMAERRQYPKARFFRGMRWAGVDDALKPGLLGNLDCLVEGDDLAVIIGFDSTNRDDVGIV